MLVMAQDSCMVCAERTKDWEIILKHPMVLLGDMGQVKAHFVLFGHIVNLSAR
jgi:hypothetical protein